MNALNSAKPSRVINLAYFLGSDSPPRVAFKLNILGMDNCFEACRLAGVNRIAYASSLAVSGEQKFYGDRLINEEDFRHGHVQYAMHKIFNEWQAQDYREKHGLEITAIRPANVTGPDKIVGSVDHVFCITTPAREKSVRFPFRDAMRCPIHVDEVAEIFARVILKAAAQDGSSPVATGRDGSVTHSLQDPGYSDASGMPASSSASTV